MYNCQSPQLRSRDASRSGSVTAKQCILITPSTYYFILYKKRREKLTSCLKTGCIFTCALLLSQIYQGYAQENFCTEPFLPPKQVYRFRQDVTQWKEEISHKFSCPAAPLSNQGSRGVIALKVTTFRQTTQCPLHAR